MKECDLGEGKVLIIKDKSKLYATGSKCTHYNAPLKSGAYCNGRIRCPWHGACFSAETGDIEDFPGLDSIYTFKVAVKGDDVVVSAPASQLGTNFRRTPSMCSRQPSDNRLFVIVGGGPAGATCAETLRSNGYTGRIVMICKENVLPYDRPKLSKSLSVQVDKILLRGEDFFQKNGVEVMLGTEVTELDAATKSLVLKNGTKITYDRCLVATGGFPRTIPAPGADLANIFPLREPQDAININNNVEGKRVVVVGSSFIGMEVASCIAKKAKSIVVIGMEAVPFERVLGEQMGIHMQKLHEKNGICFRMKRVVKEFRGVDGKVTGVLMDNGEVLDADVCIVGAGIIPATKFLKNVKIERDGSVVVDEFLKAADGLYAGGDIARFPYWLLHNEHIRVEHWGMAHYHGKLAALNMLDKNQSCKSVPFFWTTQYGKSIRYCGHALQYDNIVVEGSMDDLKFLAFYVKNDVVLAAVSMNFDPAVSAIAELMNANKMPKASELKGVTGADLIKRASTL